MNMKKLLWLALGFLGLGLGAVGAVVPLLPAFPFLLLAAVWVFHILYFQLRVKTLQEEINSKRVEPTAL